MIWLMAVCVEFKFDVFELYSDSRVLTKSPFIHFIFKKSKNFYAIKNYSFQYKK